jgi:hypothetical protein
MQNVVQVVCAKEEKTKRQQQWRGVFVTILRRKKVWIAKERFSSVMFCNGMDNVHVSIRGHGEGSSNVLPKGVEKKNTKLE